MSLGATCPPGTLAVKSDDVAQLVKRNILPVACKTSFATVLVHLCSTGVGRVLQLFSLFVSFFALQVLVKPDGQLVVVGQEPAGMPGLSAPGRVENSHVHAQVELGLIWVWPESGPEAVQDSAAKRPALCQLVKDVNPGAGDTRAAQTALSTYVHQSTG